MPEPTSPEITERIKPIKSFPFGKKSPTYFIDWLNSGQEEPRFRTSETRVLKNTFISGIIDSETGHEIIKFPIKRSGDTEVCAAGNMMNASKAQAIETDEGLAIVGPRDHYNRLSFSYVTISPTGEVGNIGTGMSDETPTEYTWIANKAYLDNTRNAHKGVSSCDAWKKLSDGSIVAVPLTDL